MPICINNFKLSLQIKGKKAGAPRRPPIPEEKIKHRYAADVVIVGAGHAGTCAARAASEVPETSVIVLGVDAGQPLHRNYYLGF